jgi:hypothetical protein
MKNDSLADWIRKQDPIICCLQEKHSRQHTYTENERMKNDVPSKWNLAASRYTHILR